jgi:hypothetical protein
MHVSMLMAHVLAFLIGGLAGLRTHPTHSAETTRTPPSLNRRSVRHAGCRCLTVDDSPKVSSRPVVT